MNQLLETKVTRTEFLDLILDDMSTELSAQIDVLAKKKAAIPEFDDKAFLKFIPAEPEINVHEYDNRVRVRIEFTLKRADLPAGFSDREKKVAALDKELEPLERRLRQIRDGKAKARIELIRKSLESSAEGRDLLEQAATLKVTLSRKMLKAGDQ